MRAVLDTNVFMSGIFWEGNFCSQIIDKWRSGSLELVSSLLIIEELVETLRSFKIPMPEEIIQEWKSLILENSIIVPQVAVINAVKEDSEDNKFIEAAVYGEADILVTQDKHLLKLKGYNKIKILKPEEAVLLF